MRSTFWPNRIFERQSSQNRHTGLKFSSKRENCALSMEIIQIAFSWSCPARFGQTAFLSVKVLKIVKLASNSIQNEKTVPFPWNFYKTLFSRHAQHVLAKSHLWASKLSQSSHLSKILPNRENSALSMEIVQNALFRSWAARFGQIASLGVIVVKFVTLASNSRQNGKTVRFSWKLYKTFFSGHAEHVSAKWHFWAAKFSKSWHWP